MRNEPMNRGQAARFGQAPFAPHQFNAAPLQMPGALPRVSTTMPSRFQPTPTFSFADELAFESPRGRARRGSGGGMVLLVLMLVAGSVGYVAVKYRVWQDTGPLVARLQELGRSLRTLAPSAAPDIPVTRAPAAPAPRLLPEVVPITRAPEPAAAKVPAKAASAPHAAPDARSDSHAHHRRAGAGKPATKEAPRPSDPTEDELLAPPADRR
ncbi:MAG TPA: hypothetical protein VHJ20_19955 [Polyangia bacterium]|nr:hypothetical protein [Polyangia bacterium]